MNKSEAKTSIVLPEDSTKTEHTLTDPLGAPPVVQILAGF